MENFCAAPLFPEIQPENARPGQLTSKPVDKARIGLSQGPPLTIPAAPQDRPFSKVIHLIVRLRGEEHGCVPAPGPFQVVPQVQPRLIYANRLSRFPEQHVRSRPKTH